MTDDRPVIIVGAPRSGTSLIQKLIRETSGFVSVPKESDMIWLPHCHPSLNDWDHEGCPDSRITPDLIQEIRDSFSSLALSASTWKRVDQLHLMDRPRLAKVLRLVYRLVFRPWKRAREAAGSRKQSNGRLVDKSVHAGLWLNLVDAVFPNACYIHMVRSPLTCVPSIMNGWRTKDRFRTFRVPKLSALDNSHGGEWWCFPMPAGWRDYLGVELVETCAFQWNAINEAILRFLSKPGFSERTLRIHLEELTSQPERTLRGVAEFIHITPGLLNNGDFLLPVVNASAEHTNIDDVVRRRIRHLTETLYSRLRLRTDTGRN